MADVVISRRDRLRGETVAEIKALALTQMAMVGPRGVSMRAIARDMGVASSAVYRYFPSLESLLGALVTDGFAALADRLEGADEDARADRVSSAERWLRVSKAYRQWALAHPTTYALVFGSACDEWGDTGPAAKDQMDRGVRVLFRVMIEGIASGDLDPSKINISLTDAMRTQLQAWKDQLQLDLTEAELSAAMLAYSVLHGTLSAELFQHLPPALLPADALFDQNMRHVLSVLGCTGPLPG